MGYLQQNPVSCMRFTLYNQKAIAKPDPIIHTPYIANVKDRKVVVANLHIFFDPLELVGVSSSPKREVSQKMV